MTYTVTSRCFRGQDIVYLSHSRKLREVTHGIRGVLGMNLVACDAPAGVLDEAPHTALRQDTAAEQWEGFWADDDRYYARCTTAAGVAWYRLEELGVAEVGPTDQSSSVLGCLDAPRSGGIGAEPTEKVLSPLTQNPLPRVGIGRRPIVFRVGQGCIVGFRHAVKRTAPRLIVAASRARSSDISA